MNKNDLELIHEAHDLAELYFPTDDDDEGQKEYLLISKLSQALLDRNTELALLKLTLDKPGELALATVRAVKAEDKLARIRDMALCAGPAHWKFADEIRAIVEEGDEDAYV